MRWWRVFINKLTGKRDEPEGVIPRRRQAERFSFATSISAKCASWPNFVDMFTGDVSEGGLFVPTDESAKVGEEIELELTLPNQSTLTLKGKVVNVIAASATGNGKPAGLGVEIEPLEGVAKTRFDKILATAKATAPQPPRPAITPTGSIRLSAVHEAVALANGSDEKLSLDDFSANGEESAEVDIVIEAEEPPAPPARAPKPMPVVGSDEIVVGIDLGTSFTSVAAVVGKKVQILPWPDGVKSQPSVINFPTEHECVVGMKARMCVATDPKHTVVSPKRLLGRRYDDREIQGFLGSAPYRTIAGPDGSVVIDIWNQQYAITQLCSYILDDVRSVASAALGQEITKCVMTVPVSFDEDRTKILRRAADMARLDVLALIDEPSSAALANRFDAGFGGIVGIFDFGGGTFDFSVVDVSRGDFQVMATAGDTWLGGDDLDLVLAEAAANQFWRKHKVDLRRQAVEWQRLLFACERAKRMLSVDDEAAIFVPDALRTAEGMVDLNISLDRATFERACSPITDRSLATCDQALALLDMQPTDLTAIYLSGGTTYVPAVREAVANHFQVPVRTGVPPEHAVCLGAAIHAAQIQYQRGATTLESRED